MANSVLHGGLPYPVKHARYTLLVQHRASTTGVPTDPGTPDTEVSLDGAAFADATEEVSVITGSNGLSYITLTGAETNCSLLGVAVKAGSGATTALMSLYPRDLPIVNTGTARAGATGTITLAADAPTHNLVGCIVRTTGGTGGGGTGGLSNQARMITAYNSTTKVATVVPDFETAPDVTTTYDILKTEFSVDSPGNGALRPATAGTTLDVTALLAALNDNVLTAAMIANAR